MNKKCSRHFLRIETEAILCNVMRQAISQFQSTNKDALVVSPPRCLNPKSCASGPWHPAM